MKRQNNGGGGNLTDEQWQRFQLLLPPQKAPTGQTAHNHGRILNGFFSYIELVRHGEVFQNVMCSDPIL